MYISVDMLIRDLQAGNFARSVEKVRSLRPQVRLGFHNHSLASSFLCSRSGGGFASVLFVVRNGQLLCRCSCPAGVASHPCYHLFAVIPVAFGLWSAGLRVRPAGDAFVSVFGRSSPNAKQIKNFARQKKCVAFATLQKLICVKIFARFARIVKSKSDIKETDKNFRPTDSRRKIFPTKFRMSE